MPHGEAMGETAAAYEYFKRRPSAAAHLSEGCRSIRGWPTWDECFETYVHRLRLTVHDVAHDQCTLERWICATMTRALECEGVAQET